jgi:outer membrane protein W
MPRKKTWAKSYRALIFILIAGFSALVSIAAPIEFIPETKTPMANSRLGAGIMGGVGVLNGYYGVGMAFGATLSYGFSRNIAIEFAGLFTSGKGKYDPETLSQGRLTVMPLQLSLLGRFPLNRKLTPYLLAGGSFFLNSFAQDSAVADGWNALGITLTEKVRNAFGFHFGGGLEYAFKQTLSVALDLRYCLGKAKGSWSIRDDATAIETSGTFSGLNLNTMIISVGLKHFFR